MMRALKYIFLIFALMSLICMEVCAMETVYVNANTGSDLNNGTESAPFATLEKAITFFEGAWGGKVVISSTLTFADDAEIACNCDGVITVTGGELVIGSKFYINAPVTFENIIFNCTAEVPMIFCEGNSVTFGDGVDTVYSDIAPIIHGGTYGGKNGVTYEKMCFSDYAITVKSGTWYYVKGGSFRDSEGQPVGTLENVTVNIFGGIFTSKKTGAADNAVVALTGFDALYGDATLNISGGTFGGCSVVGIARPGYNSTATNNQYAKGNVYINVTGGSFNGGDIRAVQDPVASEIEGDFYVKISGGTFESFGGVNGESVNGLAIADVKSGIAVQNFDSFIKLSNGGSATVTGDALIRVSGVVPSGALKISGDGKVVIEGVDGNSKITIGDVLYVGTNTEIRNIALDGYGTGIISCSDGKILIGEGVTGNGIALKNFTDGTVRSGLFSYIKGAREKSVKLHIDGATVSGDVVAVANKCNENGYVLFTSGTVKGNIYAFEYSGNEGAVHVLADGFKGKIGVAKYPANECVNTFGAVAPLGVKTDYRGCTKFNARTNAVFVRTGGTGDGTSVLSPLGDLAQAVKAANGGTVVVCGPVYLESAAVLPSVSGKTVITSKYMGLDYRDFYGAHIELSSGLRMGGETVLENIDFVAFEKYTFVSAEGHKLTVGDGVECRIFKGKRVEKYPSLIGASHAKTAKIKSVDLTVSSGTWGILAGGSYHTSDREVGNYTVTGDVNVNVFGGTFTQGVYLSGRANVGGNATLNIYGGVFECPVYAAHDDDTSVGGDVRFNLSGGTFCGDISRYGVGNSFTLDMKDGNFERVNTVDVGGGVLNLGEGISLDAKICGMGQYKNPVAGFADPSVVYSDGWYYYSYAKTYLGKDALWMAKAANIYDLGNVRPKLIWAEALNDSETRVKSIWAPQLYCLQGNWYLYATCDVGLSAETQNGRRMPTVWKAKTADPYGDYEFLGVMKNVDMDVYSYLSPRFIEHDGKLYMINGGFFRKADTVGKHLQGTMVSELSDPVTMKGVAALISSADTDYEKGIMEGPFPLHSPDGTFYIIFAAGHTRTDEYCTGVLRFIGGENDSVQHAENWVKHTAPIHQVSYKNGVYSPGAMVVTTTPDGSGYLAVYHAKEYHYSAYTMRRLYVQELRFENDFPVVDEPQPTDTVLELELNTMPLGRRISGYNSLGVADTVTVQKPLSETRYLDYGIFGDVNADNKIDFLDALALAKKTVGGKFDEFDLLRSDMNEDGKIDVGDLLEFLKIIL